MYTSHTAGEVYMLMYTIATSKVHIRVIPSLNVPISRIVWICLNCKEILTHVVITIKIKKIVNLSWFDCAEIRRCHFEESWVHLTLCVRMTTATETTQRITWKEMLKGFFFHYSKKYDVVIQESLPEDDRALDPTVKWIITWTDW